MDWSVAETILFIHLGFVCLFLNYFLLFSGLSFREYLVHDLKKTQKPEAEVSLAVAIPIGIIQFITTQFMLVLAICVLSAVSVVLVATQYYRESDVPFPEVSLDFFAPSFWWLVLGMLAVAVISFVQFLQTYRSNCTDTRKIFDWEALKVFERNHKSKLNCYIFGSTLAIIVDAVVNNEQPGPLCLLWTYLMNAWWSFVDFRQPVQKIVALERPVSDTEEFV